MYKNILDESSVDNILRRYYNNKQELECIKKEQDRLREEIITLIVSKNKRYIENEYVAHIKEVRKINSQYMKELVELLGDNGLREYISESTTIKGFDQLCKIIDFSEADRNRYVRLEKQLFVNLMEQDEN